MSDRLAVEVLPGLRLRTPLLGASGCLGHGHEAGRAGLLHGLGGIVTKTVTLRPRAGNPPPRLAETSGGLLNSIGLENPGVEAFLAGALPEVLSTGLPVLVSVGGERAEDYEEVIERLEGAEVSGYEINLSCPNVQGGALPFSTDPEACARIVGSLRRRTDRPLFVKLSPNTHLVVEVARAAAAAGADGLTLVNTLRGLAVDWRRRRPRIGLGAAGYSGPPIKPIALRIVHDVRQAVAIPILGSGGAATAEDVLEFLVAGASAVQLGTVLFADPGAPARIVSRLEVLLDEEGVRAADLVGTLRVAVEGAGHGKA